MADDPITQPVPSEVEQPASAVVAPAASVPSPQQQLLDDYDLTEHDDPQGALPPGSPEPAAASQPPPPAHPRYLIDHALEMGVAQADIDRTPTDRLAEVVFHTQRVLLNQAREQRRADAVQAAKDQPQPPVVAPAERGATAEEAVDLGINEEDFAPELVGMLKRVVGGMNKKVAALEAQLGQYQQREFAREAESNADVADRVFGKYAHALGAKGRRDLAADSPEFQKRMAVIRSVAADNSPGSLEAKLEKWAGLLFGAGGHPPAPAAGASAQAQPPAPTRPPRPQRADGTFMSDAEIAEVARWSGGTLERPTQRRGAPEVNGEAKARQSVAAALRELAAGSEGGDDLEQFPE